MKVSFDKSVYKNAPNISAIKTGDTFQIIGDAQPSVYMLIESSRPGNLLQSDDRYYYVDLTNGILYFSIERGMEVIPVESQVTCKREL